MLRYESTPQNNIIDLEIWSFFHQDKERIAYELKLFSMEKNQHFLEIYPSWELKVLFTNWLEKNR